MRIGINKSLCIRCIWTIDIPASDGILVHLRVEQYACLLVVRLGRRLSVHAAVADKFKIIIGMAAIDITLVLEHAIGDLELLGAGQRMEVYVLGVIGFQWANGQGENAIGPLEIHASHIEITLQRIKMEVIVVNTIGFVIPIGIDNDAICAQIWDICKRIIALFTFHIDHLYNMRGGENLLSKNLN